MIDQAMAYFIVAVCAVILVVNLALVIAGLLILRANQKMYTEYFKDRSIASRQKEESG